MQKIDDCKEIRLALTRAGIATRPKKCLQTFRLVVTAQYIYHNLHCQSRRGRLDKACRWRHSIPLVRYHLAASP
jgi:hypothetical protein